MSKTCDGCGSMENTFSVPYVVHESAMARAERAQKRLWVLIILLVALLVGTNLAWLIYESQFEIVEETTITQENENGYNNYIGNDGDINYGEANDNQEKISS